MEEEAEDAELAQPVCLLARRLGAHVRGMASLRTR
jgi:hypothetical protein